MIEPIYTVNIDEPVELSPTTAHRFSGILYTLVSGFLFTSSIFVTKQLEVELLAALIPRFLIQTIMLIIYMKFIKHYSFYQQLKKQELLLLFINLFFMVTGFLAVMLAYRYLPLPDLTTIRFTQVIWTAILTACLYREKPSIPIILAVLLTFTGVIFVAQPNFLFKKSSDITIDYHQHLIGFFIALYSSIGITIGLLSNKYLLTKYKTKHSLIWLQFTFVSLVVIIIHLSYKYYFLIDPIQSLKNDFINWKYFYSASICSLQIIASMLLQKAVKREHPSRLAIVQSSDILISILLQNVFSVIKSNFLSLFGSMLVLASILIISGSKLINEKKNIIKM